MSQVTQTYGFVERVTSEMWMRSPEAVRDHATTQLTNGIKAAGLVPYGEVLQMWIRGLCYTDTDLVEVSPARIFRPARREWRVTSNSQEWREEPYFDPEFTTEYRIAYALKGFAPPVFQPLTLVGVDPE